MVISTSVTSRTEETSTVEHTDISTPQGKVSFGIFDRHTGQVSIVTMDDTDRAISDFDKWLDYMAVDRAQEGKGGIDLLFMNSIAYATTDERQINYTLNESHY